MAETEDQIGENRSRSSDGSVSHLIQGMRRGDEKALEDLWAKYFDRLCSVARRKLGRKRFLSDEEDVAVSAMATMFNGLRNGQFNEYKDRDSLWRLLMHLVKRKAIKAARYDLAKKRNVEQTIRTSSYPDLSSVALPIDIPDKEQSNETIAMIGELFAKLPNDQLRNIAMTKVQGYRPDEIASMFGVSTRTIERKLRLIRTLWVTLGELT